MPNNDMLNKGMKLKVIQTGINNDKKRYFRLFNNYSEYIRQKHIRTNINNPDSEIPMPNFDNYNLYNNFKRYPRKPILDSKNSFKNNTLCHNRIRTPVNQAANIFWSKFTWHELSYEERQLWESLGFTLEIWDNVIYDYPENLESNSNLCESCSRLPTIRIPPSFSMTESANNQEKQRWNYFREKLGFERIS